MAPGVGGVGHKFLPQPNFSMDNPYWRVIPIEGVKPQYQRRLTARDFLYATAWELHRPDLVGAREIREFLTGIVRTHWKRFVQVQLQEQTLNLREKPNEDDVQGSSTRGVGAGSVRSPGPSTELPG